MTRPLRPSFMAHLKKHELVSMSCLTGLLISFFCFQTFPRPQPGSIVFILFVALPVCLSSSKTLWDLLKKSRIMQACVLLAGYICASLYWGEKTAGLKDLADYFRHTLIAAGLIGGLFLAAPLALKHLKTVFSVFILSSAGALISLICFFLTITPHSRLTHYGQSLHPNWTGQLFCLAAIGMISALARDWSRHYKFFAFCALSVLFSAIVFTSSRGSIIDITIVLVLFSAAVRDKRIVIPITAALLAVALYLGTSIIQARSPHQGGKREYISINSLVERKSAGRFRIWQDLLDRMAPAEYAAGKGLLADHTNPRNREIICHPHSVFVSSFYHGGIIALLLHVSILALAAKIGWSEFRKGSPLLLMLLGCTVFTGLVDGESIIGFATKFPTEVLFFWSTAALAITYEYKEISHD